MATAHAALGGAITGLGLNGSTFHQRRAQRTNQVVLPQWHRAEKASRSRPAVVAQASEEPREGEGMSRREVLIGTAGAVAAGPLLAGDALALTKPPKGFAAHQDSIDKYAFFFPFGWQEIAIKGQDVVFKDVIEPLESVSVTIIKTEKEDLTELGPPEELANTLVEKVLTSSNQKSKVVSASERETDGKKYYSFEFLAEAPNYTRHALSTVALANGKFYTLTTGANERRWSKMEEKLRTIVDSFTLL